MSKHINSLKQYHFNEKHKQCHCNETYKIIENYRSILDRKHQFISTWKVFHHNGKINFTHGTHFRKSSDALVIRLNSTCVINPWYKYIDINRSLLSFLQQNQCYKIFEMILLECNCSINSHEYELAIIECSCFEQLKTYCTYCRVTLEATQQENISAPTQLSPDVDQQKNISFSLDIFSNKTNMKQNFYRQSVLYDHQCAKQIYDETKENLYAINKHEIKLITFSQNNYNKQSSLKFNTVDQLVNSSTSLHLFSQKFSTVSRLIISPNTIKSNNSLSFHNNSSEISTECIAQGTQTKLFAILLPQSPLSEITSAKIETSTLMHVTRTCQINTLSYLIKNNEQQIEVEDSIENTQHSLTTSLFIQNKTQLNKEIESETKDYSKDEFIDTFEEKTMNSTSFDKHLLPSSPPKCVNAYDMIDLNEPSTLIDSFLNDTNTISSDRQDNKYYKSSHTKYEKLVFDQNNNWHSSELFQLKNNFYRSILKKRRQHRNKKLACSFLQRLRRRKKSYIIQLLSSKQFQYRSSSIPINPLQYNTSFITRQPSITKLHLNNSKSIYQYKAQNHTIIARASKNTLACKQLQIILNNSDSSLEQLIDSQLLLTCNDNYRSVCILIDDHKQSEQYRSLFIHYIYKTLSNSLKQILKNNSIHMTCMNLAFFNNSLCDIVNMQRLRLIDTGKKILLLPSCEISLQTSDDVDIAVNRLSTKMPFAHQIFIVNIHREQPCLTSSFLFLHLAPICSIRPTSLLTNLNSTNYSLLNLIRQLYNHNNIKRYLLNDYSLNRLLKNYLFSSQQTMIVLTVKPKVQEA
ncbi:unnamed protein product [Adineta steineri]|uniref:Uncharacterized protein n=1 Tax=Adineta steineri TaxID=433720 RepID=A0A816E0H9_9BILA|nr:unnamed protein product [Adineta steineri]CAF1642719.1 unnamed protein product [Adineta steineri]